MRGRWYNSLRVQILLLMTLALLPLGSVAIFQTNRVAADAQDSARLAMLSTTERAAKVEQLVIERAVGAAGLLGSVVRDFADDPARCQRYLSDFIERNPDYSFVGVLPPDGMMTCSSTGRVFDFSDYPNFAATMAAQAPTVTVNTDAPLSGTSVFIVSEPFWIDDSFAGMISISIPHTELRVNMDDLAEIGLVDLITFNGEGDILTARTGLANVLSRLPADRTLQELFRERRTAFQTENASGVEHVYSVVPIQGSAARVMGIWRTDNGLADQVDVLIWPALFPILMWFASMAVAMLSVYTLVLRHISRLRNNMDAFAANRIALKSDLDGRMPNELQALHDNFMRMTDDVVQDEARLEDALHEKNVLIKEVHHRVKNNLQLISSIMNMQIRSAREDETKAVLSRLQDRVLSLATIHRDLYQSQNGGTVNVGVLAAEVVEKTAEMAVNEIGDVDIHPDIDPVQLFPDQAVPLSLLMAEAMTNAMKYLGAPEGEKPWLRASLKQQDSHCVLTLANSVGAATRAESTGLGAQLINAFMIQLGAKMEVEQTDTSYTMIVRFEIQQFQHDARDF